MEENKKDSPQNFTDHSQEAFMLRCTGICYKEIADVMKLPSAYAAEKAVVRGALLFVHNGQYYGVDASVAIALMNGTAMVLFDKFRHKHAKYIARVEEGEYTGPAIDCSDKNDCNWVEEYLNWIDGA